MYRKYSTLSNKYFYRSFLQSTCEHRRNYRKPLKKGFVLFGNNKIQTWRARGRSMGGESGEPNSNPLLVIINEFMNHYARTPNSALQGIIFKTQLLVASTLRKREWVRFEEWSELGYAANKMPEKYTIRDCDDQWQFISGFLFHLAVNRCLFSRTASGLQDLTSVHQKPPWPSAQSARSIWTSQIKKNKAGTTWQLEGGLWQSWCYLPDQDKASGH